MKRKLHLKFIGFLLLLVLQTFYIMNVLAASPDITITPDVENASVKVDISSDTLKNEEIALICYKPQWNSNDSDMGNIEYINQYSFAEDSLSIVFKLKGEPVEGEYTLVLGSAGSPEGKIEKTFRMLEQQQPPESVTVKYVAGTGGSIKGMAEQRIVKGGNTSKVTAEPNTGYVFVKWDDGKTAAERFETNIQESKTYTATFQKQTVTPATQVTPVIPAITTYKVTLDPRGGTISKRTIDVKAGEKIGTIPTPTRKGYKFKGWYASVTGGVKITSDTKVTKAMTIYAVWDEQSLAKGAEFISGKLKYKVVKVAGAKKGTVQVVGPAKKTYTSISIPKTTKSAQGSKYTYNVVSIRKNAFKKNTKLKTVVIGSNVQTIGNSAFAECKALKKVTIGKNVTKIDKKAFYNSKKLNNIIIKGKKLKTIGSKAFGNISGKAKIKVPKSKLASYTKKLKGKGLKSTVKISK